MIAICRNQLDCPSKLRSTYFRKLTHKRLHYLNPFISMQMKKSQLQVTKAYYSKAVKAAVEKQHLKNKKSISNICVFVVLLFITGWVG